MINQIRVKNEYCSGYLDELIEDLIKEIPSNFKQLFKNGSLKEEIENVLWTYYAYDYATDRNQYRMYLTSLSDKAKRNISQNCLRLSDALKYNADTEYDLAKDGIFSTDTQSPFNEAFIKRVCSQKRIDQSTAIEDVYASIKSWYTEYAKNRSVASLGDALVGLSDYPYFYLFDGSKKWSKFIRNDLLLFMAKLFTTRKYSHYFELVPTALVGAGMTTDNRSKALEELGTDQIDETVNALAPLEALNSDKLLKTFFHDETTAGNFVVLKSYSLWEAREWEIFSLLVTKFISSSRSITGTLKVQGSYTELLDAIYPEKEDKESGYGMSIYRAMFKSLGKIANATVIAEVDGKVVIKHLFQEAKLDDPSAEIEEGTSRRLRYELSFGDAIASNILSGLLLTVSTPARNSLATEEAKLLFDAIKLDRLTDVALRNGREEHIYTLDELQSLVRFSGSRPKKVKKYLEAFAELKDKKIMVNDFRYEDELFRILWKPLSHSEEYDLRYHPDLGSIEAKE